LAKPLGPACGAVLFGGQNGSTSPASSKALMNALLDCYQTACGFMAPSTDDFSSSPCADMTSVACGQCVQHSEVNCIYDVTDTAKDMTPWICTAGAAGCKATSTNCSNSRGTIVEGLCGSETAACLLDCNGDADCAGITCGGIPTFCDVGATQQCICQ
jgi:hypothetical protein